MIKIAICMKDLTFSNDICRQIQHCCSSIDNQIGIKQFNDIWSLLEVVNDQDFDLIFLEIKMLSDERGLVSEQLKEITNDMTLIFVTDSVGLSSDKVEDKFTNSVILKNPISYEKIQSLVNETNRLSFFKKKKSLLVKNEQGIFKIRLNEIVFIESSKKNTIIHTQNEQITSYKTMKEYENRLREYRFYRCHISYIVNTDYVANIQENVLRMNNRKIIPISRYRRKELVQIMHKTKTI